MPKDFIDIVDTAVKIGLGAMISGLSTYFLTNKMHLNDKKKAFVDKKVSILEYSTENIEPYLDALYKCFSRVDGALRMGISPGEKTGEELIELGFWECDENLIKARTEKSAAISRLSLIGAKEVTKTLSKIVVIEDEFRQMLIFEKNLPNKVQLVDFKRRFKEEMDNFYVLLGKEFSGTYD